MTAISDARKRAQEAAGDALGRHRGANRGDVDPSATATAEGPQNGAGLTGDWSVGVVAQTVAGEVVLRMTTEQADELRDSLIWVTGDDR